MRKRNKTWWTDFTAPNGKRIRRSAQTQDKQQALEFEDTLKSEFWRIQKMGDKPKHLWQEATIKYIKEKKARGMDVTKDIAKLQWFDQYLRDVYIDDIDLDLVNYIADEKESEGVVGATVNRYLALLRPILYSARDRWGWLDKAPKMPMRVENGARDRWITEAEVQRLLSALPNYYALPASFSLAMGPRQSNVLGLRWEQIDLKRRMVYYRGHETKNGKSLSLPLNEDAMHVLAQCKDLHEEYVFSKEGQRITEIRSVKWAAALKKADLKDFRWHDLRHTWASRHIQNGTSLAELQILGGWKTYLMVLRYAHLSAGQLMSAASNINGSALLLADPDAHQATTVLEEVQPIQVSQPALYIVR